MKAIDTAGTPTDWNIKVPSANFGPIPIDLNVASKQLILQTYTVVIGNGEGSRQ
jgi:hypothetical protein